MHVVHKEQRLSGPNRPHDTRPQPHEARLHLVVQPRCGALGVQPYGVSGALFATEGAKGAESLRALACEWQLVFEMCESRLVFERVRACVLLPLPQRVSPGVLALALVLVLFLPLPAGPPRSTEFPLATSDRVRNASAADAAVGTNNATARGAKSPSRRGGEGSDASDEGGPAAVVPPAKLPPAPLPS